MAGKTKQTETTNNKSTAETWRKPLQVPPRRNAMRSFYRGAEDEAVENVNQTDETDEIKAANGGETELDEKIEINGAPQFSPEEKDREAVEIKSQDEQKPVAEISEESSDSDVVAVAATEFSEPSTTASANKLTKEELSEQLGIEIEDLFDVHELLRGKSFEIYQTLMQSADENGRCKITQPELMKRTGIKNRRTFYKHEEWLIKLKLLEKRHLPGDHKGVVYRVMELSDALPISSELLAKFKHRLEDTE